MSPSASLLSIQGLAKRYGRLNVLRGLDLSIPDGAVYGLVGLNGSGKTTTLECALGLLRPSAGVISILGLPPRRLFTLRGRVGVVFDTPCLHPNLTVRQTLNHALMVCGDRSRPPQELERLLSLTTFRSRKVRRLSHGTRKRAAIAHALVGRPRLLVLDEPFSGLDAGGVQDLLDLIRILHTEGETAILLASHQLPYLERICTHVGILHGGAIARGGILGELLADRGSRLRLKVDDPARARACLHEAPGVRSIRDEAGGLRLEGTEIDPAMVNRQLVGAGISVTELLSQPPSLEALFREVVGGPE